MSNWFSDRRGTVPEEWTPGSFTRPDALPWEERQRQRQEILNRSNVANQRDLDELLGEIQRSITERAVVPA